MVVAAKGSRQAAASPLLDLARFNDHVEHDHLWEKGNKLHFPLRLLACWCSNGSCLLLEADHCATYPFWALGTSIPGGSGTTTAAQLTLADLLETVACRFPSMRLGSVGDDISTQTAVTAKMVTVVTCDVARLVTQGPKSAQLASVTALGIGSTDAARNVGADLRREEARHSSHHDAARGGLARKASTNTREGRCYDTEPHNFGFERRFSLGVGHSRFHADTAQVSSYRYGQGGLQAQPGTESQHHHARPVPDWRPRVFGACVIALFFGSCCEENKVQRERDREGRERETRVCNAAGVCNGCFWSCGV